MLTGTCHCGTTGWTLNAAPESATACNCTICRRYGALWAYGYVGRDIETSGQTSTYLRQDSGDICFQFCPICGCIMYFAAKSADQRGRYRAAVNLRMSDLSLIHKVPIRRFEGHNSFKALPGDGRTIEDVWF
ncbi:GFA family protein [Ruegeria atlantica]|uniref:GFA family protein n=1 Tax=Ruegeria atlantica TaxID=81569 RepID=UPI00147B65C5